VIRPFIDVVIPVLNEAHVLERSVATVRRYLLSSFPYPWRIVVVDNGSTDGTDAVARRLAEAHQDVLFLHIGQAGRGRALRLAWLQSSADAVCYMDVDLSTALPHLNQLAAAIFEEGYDVVTGSRLLPESRVRRSAFREFISRGYNLLVRLALGTGFSDAQCGFKGASRRAVEAIVPQVRDQSWFFDTELLYLSEKQGFRIKDIPVAWHEDDDSRVKILQTAWDDIQGIRRLRAASAAPSAAALPDRRQP
jgi:glycosyltransferase involved in cell wall biosynthesis